jgi:hypothetical protein
MEYPLVAKRAGGVGVSVSVFTTRLSRAVELEPLRQRTPLNIARV